MEEKINETFNLVRNSTEIGIGSCSVADECYSDAELISDIRDFFEKDKGYILASESTPQDYFYLLLSVESVHQERELM